MLEQVRVAEPTEINSSQGSSAVGDNDPPIDLVHLSRQCQGDPALEEELLGLFCAQVRALAAQLSDPQMPLELKANLAHKLRGSALAIGAGRVARAAKAVEDMGLTPSVRATSDAREGRASLAITALQAAATEAATEIERLRG